MLEPNQFRRGLEAACSAQLREQEDSIGRLFQTILALHERNAESGPSAADQIHLSNGYVEEDRGESAVPEEAATLRTFGMDFPKEVEKRAPLDPTLLGKSTYKLVSTAVKDKATSGELTSLVPVLSTPKFANQLDVRNGAKCFQQDDLQREEVAADSIKHQKTVDKIIDECHIENLPFITANGDILRPPSAMQRVMTRGGSKLRTHQGFFNRLVQCRDSCRSVRKHCSREPEKGVLARFVGSEKFKVASAIVIISNFFFIVAQSDYKMAHLNQEEPEAMAIIGYCFTGYYTFEVLLKLKVEGDMFFNEHEVLWNVFDSVIVTVAIVEIIIKQSGAAMVNTSFLRILRFFKLSRVIRMFSAMRMFKEIRIMLDSLCGCFTLFCFCGMIMSLFLSVYAIFFVQGATEFLESGNELPPEELENLQMYFGSTSRGMLSLFKVTTGGDDWSLFHDSIKPLGWFYDLLFIVFVMSYFIAFLNVVTATFCEKAISLAVPTTEELIQHRLHKEFNDAQELMKLLKNILDDNGSHLINYDGFEELMSHPEVQIYFEVRGLKPTSAHRFFKTLCEVNGKDTVDFATFVSACIKLDGSASSIDMHCQAVRELHSYHKLTAMSTGIHEETREMHRILQQEVMAFGSVVKDLHSSVVMNEKLIANSPRNSV